MDDTEELFRSPAGLFDQTYIAIGTLIHMFAIVESSIFSVFRSYVGIPDDVTRAILGEARLGDTIAAFKRVATVRGMDAPSKTLVDDLFARTLALKKYRDCVAHRSFHLNMDYSPFLVVFSLHPTAKSTKGGLEVRYTVDEIDICTREARNLSAQIFELATWLRGHPLEASFDQSALDALQRLALPETPILPTSPDQQIQTNK
ncbi:hypothetical protein [Mesorhizobium sp. M0036]|uniref:hypothetical protein n=1 Tax=Mesorhizobium sp. M0036 TaxID=2956853 RepID=UPI003336D0FD